MAGLRAAVRPARRELHPLGGSERGGPPMKAPTAAWRVATDQIAAILFWLVPAVVVLFLLLPIVVSVFLSFDDREFLGAFPPTKFSLRWYRSFFDNPAYLQGLVTSLKLALVSTA